MKVNTVINGWSVLQTAAGVACKYVQGDSEFEVCLSIVKDTEVLINVYRDGVDLPVAVMSLEGE